MTGERQSLRYWREIAAILVVKLAVLYAIHEAFFDQPMRRAERVQHMTTNIYGDMNHGAMAAEEEKND